MGIEVQFSSESVEWYTPLQYIEAARRVLGKIDLDPASCASANSTVKASRFFTIDDDGLSRDWVCETLFVNPPYGRRGAISNQALWSARLISEFNAGHITTGAILLVNACTSEKWFQPLYQYPICFTNHRIRFYNGNGTQPTKGNAFIYFGNEPERFFREFMNLGAVVMRVRPKPEHAATTAANHSPTDSGT
jgi:DNA N-6-adenine-methyltransferase (Dam)